MGRVKASELRGKKKEELNKQLEDLRTELATLRVAKVGLDTLSYFKFQPDISMAEGISFVALILGPSRFPENGWIMQKS